MVQFVIRSSQKLINYAKVNTSIGFGIYNISNFESFYASKADLINYGTNILFFMMRTSYGLGEIL